MSPLNIKILLHVYAIVADYRDCEDPQHAHSVAVRTTFEWFAAEGLIEKIIPDADWSLAPRDDRGSQFKITPKGEAMVDAICAVQIPICKWVQP